MPTLEAFGMSDPGLVRQNNEDTWFLDLSMGLAIVADGMGGASCGEVASSLAVEVVVEYLRKPPVSWPPEQLLEEAIQEANRRVYERASAQEGCSGMGSTIVAALWELPRMVVANVGDSRAYLWREGELRQLSYDQTLVNELRLRFGLTAEEVSNFPHRNVLTMAVGTTSDLLVRFVPVNQTPDTFKDSDIVIITGYTLLNRTLDDLLHMIPPACQVVVVGPSSSFIPDILFRHRVDIIGSVSITDRHRLFEVVSEAGAGFHLFRYCAKKICLVNDHA